MGTIATRNLTGVRESPALHTEYFPIAEEDKDFRGVDLKQKQGDVTIQGPWEGFRRRSRAPELTVDGSRLTTDEGENSTVTN